MALSKAIMVGSLNCVLPPWTSSGSGSTRGRVVMRCNTPQGSFSAIQQARVIACVRAQSADTALDMARAALDGGLNVLEVTMTTPGAPEAISKLVEEYPSAIIGAGTVLSITDADSAKAAGAKFLMSPVAMQDLIESHCHGPTLVIPGAITPTEVFNAYRQGASLVKQSKKNQRGVNARRRINVEISNARQPSRAMQVEGGGTKGADAALPSQPAHVRSHTQIFSLHTWLDSSAFGASLRVFGDENNHFQQLYPVTLMGGMKLVQALKKAMPHIPLVASQGITFEMFDQYLRAGATAVVLSDAIFSKALINSKDHKKMRQQAIAVAEKAALSLRDFQFH